MMTAAGRKRPTVGLVTYGGLLLLVVNDANGNITSYAWQQATATTS